MTIGFLINLNGQLYVVILVKSRDRGGNFAIAVEGVFFECRSLKLRSSRVLVEIFVSRGESERLFWVKMDDLEAYYILFQLLFNAKLYTMHEWICYRCLPDHELCKSFQKYMLHYRHVIGR